MTSSPGRPNVIVVHAHNSGRFFGCYDNDINTPHVDAMADEGIRFDNFHCTAAQCSPSRGSLWTGNYPHNNGLVGLAHLGWELNDDETTLMERLRSAGYTTRLFGIQHISENPEGIGFDHVEGSMHTTQVDEPASTVAERVSGYLDSTAAREEPFMLSVGFSEAHREMTIPRCLDSWSFDVEGYDRADPESVDIPDYLPDREGIREDLAGLYGMISEIDRGVGEIREALRNSGLEENTLLVFTTDHGIGFPGAMQTCYDPGVASALLMHWPGVIDDGSTDQATVAETLLSGVDFTPTVLDLADETPPNSLDGRSFAPIFFDRDYQPRERIFLEFTWHVRYNPMRAVRTKRYKYIRNFGDLPRMFTDTGTKAGREMLEECFGAPRPEEELYDLKTDPLEDFSLVDEDDYSEELEWFREQIDKWMHQTDDPLLDGDWPPTDKQLELIKKVPWHPEDTV